MKRILRAGFYLFILMTTFAQARAPEPYLTLSFDQAVKEKKYILLHFFASWCPSCKAQEKILKKVMKEDSDLRKVVTLVIPYDEALKLRKEYKVNRQSTLIVMKGNKELAREAGITDKDLLVSFLKTHVASE